MRQAIVSEDVDVLALRALGWTLADPARADRLLAVTGIDPADLRGRLNDPTVLGATLNFLLAHEADLTACATALDVPPQSLADAARTLEAA